MHARMHACARFIDPVSVIKQLNMKQVSILIRQHIHMQRQQTKQNVHKTKQTMWYSKNTAAVIVHSRDMYSEESSYIKKYKFYICIL